MSTTSMVYTLAELRTVADEPRETDKIMDAYCKVVLTESLILNPES